MPQSDRILLRSSPSEDTTPEMGIALGRALAMDFKRVVVARDLMRSSTMMKNALVAGLLSSGADVLDLGCTSAPVAAFSSTKGDCTVYVTEYREYGLMSGFILINPNGSLFKRDRIRHLEKIFTDPPAMPDYRGLGTLRHYRYATEDYNEALRARIGEGMGGSLILDCGCGAGSESAPQILNAIGSDVITVNAQFDRDFTSSPMNVGGGDNKDLSLLIKSEPGCIGVAMNRIGSLISLMDEDGNVVPFEKLAALIVLYMRPRTVVVPADMSSLIEDAFGGMQGVSVKTPAEMPPTDELRFIRVGQSASIVCDAVAENGAELGFYDGGIIFGDVSMMSDGIYASAVVSRIAAENSINKVVETLPSYYRDRKVFEYECDKDDFIRMLEESFGDLNSKSVSRYGDAWRIDMDEGWFFLSLDDSSGVEVVAESRDRAYIVGLMEVIGDLVGRCSIGQ